MTLTKEALSLRFFYAKHTDSVRNSLIAFFPQALQKKILEESAIPYSPKTVDISTYLSYIHPSHITDYLSTLEKNEQMLYLSVLKNPQKTAYLKPLCLENFTPYKLKDSFQSFLSSLLCKKIIEKENFYPQECFKENPFVHLLYLDFNAFERLLEVLSMYDVHFELHTIISKEKIISLTKSLNQDQCDFLQVIRAEKNYEPLYPMNLQTFDGNATTLSLILRQRALNRLAKALASTQVEFIDQLYLRLSSIEKSLFKKLFLAYQGKEFKQQKDHLKKVIAFIKG